jgi:hypothetical protein
MWNERCCSALVSLVFQLRVEAAALLAKQPDYAARMIEADMEELLKKRGAGAVYSVGITVND